MSKNQVMHKAASDIALSILETSPLAVIAINSDFRVIWCNKAALAKQKFNEAEVSSKLFEDAFPMLNTNNLKEVYRKIFSGESNHLIANQVLKFANGEEGFFEIDIQPFQRNKKVVDGICCTLREVEGTNSKATKELFDNSSDLIYILNRTGIFVDVNRQVLQKYGYQKEEIIGNTPAIFSAPGRNDEINVAERIHQAWNGNPQQFDWWSIKKDGSIFPKEVVLRKGVYYGKEVIIAAGRDISERVKARQAIQRSEELFRQLFQNSPIGIVMLDEKNRILQSNKSFKRIFQFSDADLEGKKIDNVIVPTHLHQEAVMISKRTLRGQTYNTESVRMRKDGSLIPVLIYGVPVLVENKRIGFYGIYIDISVRKQAEEDMKQRTNELLRSNAELEQYAYVTSHNLRAPIVNLQSLLDLYNENDPADEKNRVIIDKFKKSLEQLSGILNDLINIVARKKELSKPKRENQFQKIFQDVIQSIEDQVRIVQPVIDADFSSAPSIIYLEGHLYSIFLNLLTNSIKYRAPGKPLKITVRTSYEDGMVKLSFSDNGIGMDLKKHGHKLFGLYQRFNEEIDGKGLGLYIVKSQVESLGGKIDVESELTQGTTFHIYMKNFRQ